MLGAIRKHVLKSTCCLEPVYVLSVAGPVQAGRGPQEHHVATPMCCMQVLHGCRRTTAARVDRECLCMKNSLSCRSQSLLSSETRGRNSSYIFDCSRNILSTIPFFHQKGTTRQPFFTFSTKKALPASHFSLFPKRHYPPAIFHFFHKKRHYPPAIFHK